MTKTRTDRRVPVNPKPITSKSPTASEAGTGAPATTASKPLAQRTQMEDGDGGAGQQQRLGGELNSKAVATQSSIDLGDAAPAKISPEQFKSGVEALIARFGAHVVAFGGRTQNEVMLKAPIRGMYPAWRLEDGKLNNFVSQGPDDLGKPITLDELAARAAQVSKDIDATAVKWLDPFEEVVSFDEASRTLTLDDPAGKKTYRLDAGEFVDSAGQRHSGYDLRAPAADARMARGGVSRAQIEALAKQVGWGLQADADGIVKIRVPTYYTDLEYTAAGGALVRKYGNGPERMTLDELKATLLQRNADMTAQGEQDLSRLASTYPQSVVQVSGRSVTVTPPLAPDRGWTMTLQDDGMFHRAGDGWANNGPEFSKVVDNSLGEAMQHVLVRTHEDLFGGRQQTPEFNALATFDEDAKFGIGQPGGQIRWFELEAGRIVDSETKAEVSPASLQADFESLRARKLAKVHAELDGPLAERPWAKMDPKTGHISVGGSTFLAWGDGYRSTQAIVRLDAAALLKELDRLKPW